MSPSSLYGGRGDATRLGDHLIVSGFRLNRVTHIYGLAIEAPKHQTNPQLRIITSTFVKHPNSGNPPPTAAPSLLPLHKPDVERIAIAIGSVKMANAPQQTYTATKVVPTDYPVSRNPIAENHFPRRSAESRQKLTCPP